MLSAEEQYFRSFPEAWVQRQVEERLALYRWIYYHAPDNVPRNGHAQKIKRGFPDICAVRGRRIVFMELKRQTGKTTEDQDEWLAALAATGKAETYIIRPEQVLNGTVDQILRPEWSTT
jgi:hypothetical protein